MTAVIKIFAPILSFATSHATALSLVGLVVAAGTCVHQRDARIAEEARREALVEVHEERMEALTTQVEEMEAERARADSQAVLDAKRFAAMRREADSLRAAAERAAREASTEVARAGDALDATLDSLYAVAPPPLTPLIAEAKDQHRAERAAHRSLANALDNQLAKQAQMLAAADSTTEMWRDRYRRLEAVHDVQTRALREARAAVGVTGSSGDSWTSRALLVAGGAVVGLVVAAGM